MSHPTIPDHVLNAEGFIAALALAQAVESPPKGWEQTISDTLAACREEGLPVEYVILATPDGGANQFAANGSDARQAAYVVRHFYRAIAGTWTDGGRHSGRIEIFCDDAVYTHANANEGNPQ